jgi:hypothetical protein
MQKIRNLLLAAGLFASAVTGTTILTLTQSAAPALASSPHCDPYGVGQPTTPAPRSLNPNVPIPRPPGTRL